MPPFGDLMGNVLAHVPFFSVTIVQHLTYSPRLKAGDSGIRQY